MIDFSVLSKEGNSVKHSIFAVFTVFEHSITALSTFLPFSHVSKRCRARESSIGVLSKKRKKRKKSKNAPFLIHDFSSSTSLGP